MAVSAGQAPGASGLVHVDARLPTWPWDVSPRHCAAARASSRRAVQVSRVAWLLVVTFAGPAVAPALQPLRAAAPGASPFRVVIVAEGYRLGEHDAFYADAAALWQAVVATPPWQDVAPLIEAEALFVPSSDAGADLPSQQHWVDTAFDATFEWSGIAHLLVCDAAKVIEAVAAAQPAFDLAVVLVQDPRYGGSGGVVPVVSKATDAVEILRHELGHAVSGLADEYEHPYPGYPAGDPEPNVASAAHLGPPKWAAWLSPGVPIPTDPWLATATHAPVGAYEGARYLSKGMFRPTPQCAMRTLGTTYCPVCTEAITATLVEHAVTADRVSPAQELVLCADGACPALVLGAVTLPNVGRRWLLDDTEVAHSVSQWQPPPLPAGDHIVTASVTWESGTLSPGVALALRRSTSWLLRVSARGAADGDDDMGSDADTTLPELALGDGEPAMAGDADPATSRARAPEGCQPVRAPTNPGGGREVMVLFLMVLASLGARRRRACGAPGAPTRSSAPERD